MFEAEFCPANEKEARLRARNMLLEAESERAHIPA
jgi:hypothetical protein